MSIETVILAFFMRILLTMCAGKGKTRWEKGGGARVRGGEGGPCHSEVSAPVLECLVDGLVPE